MDRKGLRVYFLSSLARSTFLSVGFVLQFWNLKGSVPEHALTSSWGPTGTFSGVLPSCLLNH